MMPLIRRPKLFIWKSFFRTSLPCMHVLYTNVVIVKLLLIDQMFIMKYFYHFDFIPWPYLFIKIQNFDITMSVLKSIKCWQRSGQNTNNISLLHEDRSKLAALGHSEITPWSASKILKFEEEGMTTFMSHFIEVTTAWSGVVYEINLFVAFLVSRWSWCVPVHPWFVNYVSATLMYIE